MVAAWATAVACALRVADSAAAAAALADTSDAANHPASQFCTA